MVRFGNVHQPCLQHQPGMVAGRAPQFPAKPLGRLMDDRRADWFDCSFTGIKLDHAKTSPYGHCPRFPHYPAPTEAPLSLRFLVDDFSGLFHTLSLDSHDAREMELYLMGCFTCLPGMENRYDGLYVVSQ